MEKFGDKQKNTLILLIVALAVYFFMRYFFAITVPFLLAFLMIWKVYPHLVKISAKTKLKETWILGIFIFLAVFLLLTILYVPLSTYFEDVAYLEEDENILESELFKSCVEKYDYFKKTCSKYVGEDMMGKIQSGAISSVKLCISFFTYIIIFFVSLFLFCKDFEKIRQKIEERESNTFIRVTRGVVSYVKAFLKSQVIIFIVLSLLIGTVLMVLKVPNAWAFGFLAGALDAFPFVGTGIVLVPLSIWLFLKGQIFRGILCLVLYGVCALLRELLEPKLIGEKIGIYPIILFSSVFVGMQIFGVGGIIKGPLSVVILYEYRKVLLAKEKKV